MSDNEQLLREVTDRVAAIVTEDEDGKIAEHVRAQAAAYLDEVIDEAVSERVSAALVASDYKPDPTSEDVLRGTVYGRMGMSMSDVEFAHDLLSAAQDARPNKWPGPSERMRNIVGAARKQREMDTAESGYGSQLVADAEYIPELWDAAREDYGVLVSAVETRAMTGPVEKHPVLANVPLMLYAAEKTGTIGSGSEYTTVKVGSNEVTLTAKKLIGHMQTSGELVEDSIVPLVPLLRRAAGMSLAKTADHLILNGDDTNAATGNINLDDADPTDTLYYLAMDGVRHAYLVDNTGNATDHSGNSLTYEAIVKLPTLMIDRTYDMHWGRPAQPDQLIYIASPELENDIMTLSEMMTVEKRGLQAAVNTAYAPLNGELCRIGRNPLVTTIAMSLTESDGKVSTTSSNNTLGAICAWNPTGCLWGIKREAMWEVEREAGFDQWRFVLSTRVALGRYSPTGAASGIEWAAGLYNISNG